MPDLADLARQLVTAAAAGDAAALHPLLHSDARLRWWGWQGAEAHRPRALVAARLAGEWPAAAGARLTLDTLTPAAERVIVEYRVQVTDPATGRCVEHPRALIATPLDGLLHTLDLYCAEPVPSAPRNPPPAPADTSDAELHRMFDQGRSTYDPRAHGVSLDRADLVSLRGGYSMGVDPHPASGFVGGARWSAAEADERIAAIIERFRAVDHGFQWWVSPYDTPLDLPARLERHGLLRAGGYEKMARRQLADLSDIPDNPELEVVEVDGTDEAVFQATMHVIAVSFNAPPEQAASFAAHWRERLQDAAYRAKNIIYLARQGGQAAGAARLSLQGPLGYLVAGSTLPEFRGRHVYSTLLRRRLEAARDRGYHIVSLDAGPMSRRVVERYGFQPYGTTHVFGWMPVMDPAVIRTLVPDD